jgi:hypothetical protein
MASVSEAPNPLRSGIADAFRYLFPVYEMARTRYTVVRRSGFVPGAPVQLRALRDHRSRAVTLPNNDTLYTTAWLDLAAAPVLVGVPRIEGRY